VTRSLPSYLCPFSSCDGSGWSVDESTRLATRCLCMDERIRMRDEHAAQRDAQRDSTREPEEAAW
jgi:hypothetical protein